MSAGGQSVAPGVRITSKSIQAMGPNGLWQNVTIWYVSPVNWMHPWVDVTSFSTPRQVPVPPPVLPPAFLRWGKPSVFNVDDSFRDDAGSPGFNTNDPDDPDQEVLQFTETGRSTSDKRVENPDDPDQFVIVAQIDSMTLDGPNGKKYKFTFSNPD